MTADRLTSTTRAECIRSISQTDRLKSDEKLTMLVILALADDDAQTTIPEEEIAAVARAIQSIVLEGAGAGRG